MSPTPSTSKDNTIRLGLVLAAVLALSAFAPRASWSADGEPAGSEKSGEAGLESLRAEDLRPLLEGHRGKVVLVNFWATWCGPCIQEIPALIDLREKLEPSSFALVAISLDDPADSSWLVQEFIETRFPKWESYLSAEIEEYLLVEELDPYWSGVMPANYLIGPDGSVAKTLLGGHSEEKFAEAIRTLLPEAKAPIEAKSLVEEDG